MAKTIIETEHDSVVLLSRESYDMMRAMMTASNMRSVELAKMRDKFESRVVADDAKEKSRGYTKYYTVSEVLKLFRETFEIVPKEPETTETTEEGDEA